MFPRNRPVGRMVSALLGLIAMVSSTTMRHAVCVPLERAATAVVYASTPVVYVTAPPGVIAAARFIARRYRVPVAQSCQIAEAVFRISEEHRINPYLVLAVIAVESSFRPHVVNPYGDAYGLMQIALRVHARRVAAVGGRQRLFLVAPNIRIGVALLAQYGAGVRSGIRHALWRYSGGEYGYARKVLQLSALLQRNGAHL